MSAGNGVYWSSKEQKGRTGEGQGGEFRSWQRSFALGQGFGLGRHNCRSPRGCARGVELAELFYQVRVRNREVKSRGKKSVIMRRICLSSLLADEGTV